MSPSRNFPAQAEPSYEGSEPSRAELGHFDFRAETELTILTLCMSKGMLHTTRILLLSPVSNMFSKTRSFSVTPFLQTKM